MNDIIKKSINGLRFFFLMVNENKFYLESEEAKRRLGNRVHQH